MSNCSRCIHLGFDGNCTIHRTRAEDCDRFRSRGFDVMEHLCGFCSHLQSCRLGRSIQEGDFDQLIRRTFKVKGELELRVVVPACKSFEVKEG